MHSPDNLSPAAEAWNVQISLGVGLARQSHRPELATFEEASEPLSGVPLVPRPLLGVEVDPVEAEAHFVAEEVLEHVEEGPHEVALHVRPVPDDHAATERRMVSKLLSI